MIDYGISAVPFKHGCAWTAALQSAPSASHVPDRRDSGWRLLLRHWRPNRPSGPELAGRVPREVQEIAFDKGMIPYIPADRDWGSNCAAAAAEMLGFKCRIAH